MYWILKETVSVQVFYMCWCLVQHYGFFTTLLYPGIIIGILISYQSQSISLSICFGCSKILSNQGQGQIMYFLVNVSSL